MAAGIDAAAPPPARTSAGIDFALTRLVAGLTEAIAFVEVGPNSVTLQTLMAGARGVPAQMAGDSLRWPDFLPLLPDDDDVRRMRMAGSLRDDGTIPDVLRALVGEAIIPALNKLHAVAFNITASRPDPDARGGNSLPSRQPYRMDVVLVRRTYRWPVLDAAITQARLLLRPVAEVVVGTGDGELAAVVANLSVRAPLRYAYDLVLADVGRPGQAVQARSEQLFAAGTAVRPGIQATVTRHVSPVSPHAAERVALPVVARRTEAVDFRDPQAVEERRPLVQMAELSGSAGQTELQITLVRPDLLSFRGAPALPEASSAPPPWPALLARLPDRLPATNPLVSQRLDVVLLVELGGDEQVVADRVRLAREVADALSSTPPTVRVAVLGYRDHFGMHRIDAIPNAELEDEALVVGCNLASPARVVAFLGEGHRWDNVPIGDNLAAPIEDALQMLAGRKWNWSPAARRVLLIIGARPPHPPKVGPAGEEVLPCPHRWSWADAYARLAAGQVVECLAVLDRAVTEEYARECWRRLAPRRVYPRERITADQLMRAIGLLPPPAASPDFPLAVLAGGVGALTHVP
jgi:hypothetical protein